MAKFLLSFLAAGVAASGLASSGSPNTIKSLDINPSSKSVSLRNSNASRKASSPSGIVKAIKTSADISPASGRIQMQTQSVINPRLRKAAAARTNGRPAYCEDFEGWDKTDSGWLPAGVSLRHQSDREDAETWIITDPAAFGGALNGVTGNSLSINFDDKFLDEWVVFPEVTLGAAMALTFDALNDPIWYFSLENVDWDKEQYTGDKIPVYDQQIMISEDDGQTWTMLKSLSEEYINDDLQTLVGLSDNSMKPVNVSLAQYAGKTVRLAFRYVGTDGNLGVIDNISIGNPPLPVSYINPWGTLYFGMSSEGLTLNTPVLVGPVYRDMTFINYSDYVAGAVYSWDYFGPESDWQTADTQDYLEVKYHTDYTDESTTVNNLYKMPVLTGTADGFTENSFTREGMLQAGGKGSYLIIGENGSKSMIDLGLTVVDPSTEGMQTVTDFGMPLFGYDSSVDRYWTEYTYGEDWNDNNYVKLDAYMDYFMTSEAPIVIRGVRTNAYGRIKDGVKFVAEIVALSDEGVILDEPLARTECDYSGVSEIDYGGINNFLSLNFAFSEPLVISSDICPAYLVRISGFNDPEHVEYFSPILSAKSNPDEMALGWIRKSIVNEGISRYSTTPVANYVEDYIAFYIMIDAEFPWLEGPESVDGWNGMCATVTLDSSAAGDDLRFENLPGWLTAKVEGQYGDTKVTLNAAVTDEIKEDAEITISAPGVSHTITVKAPQSNAVDAVSSECQDSEIYNVAGGRVNTTEPAGIYIIRNKSGQSRKIIR